MRQNMVREEMKDKGKYKRLKAELALHSKDKNIRAGLQILEEMPLLSKAEKQEIWRQLPEEVRRRRKALAIEKTGSYNEEEVKEREAKIRQDWEQLEEKIKNLPKGKQNQWRVKLFEFHLMNDEQKKAFAEIVKQKSQEAKA